MMAGAKGWILSHKVLAGLGVLAALTVCIQATGAVDLKGAAAQLLAPVLNPLWKATSSLHLHLYLLISPLVSSLPLLLYRSLLPSLPPATYNGQERFAYPSQSVCCITLNSLSVRSRHLCKR